MQFHDIDGIIGKSFQLGYGKDSFTFTIGDDGVLTIQFNNEPIVEGSPYSYPLRFRLMGGIDCNNGAIKSTFAATDNADVVNLSVLKTKLEAYLTSAKTYTDQKIQESGGGSSGGGGTSPMLSPLAITVDNMTDGYSAIIGTLAANKFIDRVIFEIKEPFSKLDGTDFDISVGTAANPTSLVPTFQMSTLTETKVVDICKTLTSDAEYCIFISAHQEPIPPSTFEQEFYNHHPTVSSSMTSDASDKIWTIILTGNDLESSVLDTETFGDVEGPFMDFSFNIPVEAGHQYRIVQTNPALQYYDGKDEFVSNKDGVWTKDKNYDFGDVEEVELGFIMTESAGAEDYTHFYIYDLNSETPNTAIRNYHIKNGLHFKGSSPAVSPLQIDFASASEVIPGIVKNADNQYTITLTGQVTSKTADLTEKFTGLTKKATSLSIFYPNTISTSGIRTIVYNPGAKELSDVQTASGVTYTDATYTPDQEEDGAWIEFPVTESQEYPIVIVVIDLATKDYTLIGVDNSLIFSDPPAEDTVETLSFSDMARSIPNQEVKAIPLAAGDTGSMLLRILSF